MCWQEPHPREEEGEQGGGQSHGEAQPFTEKGFVHILHAFLNPTLSPWGSAFPDKLCSNRLLRGVFLK